MARYGHTQGSASACRTSDDLEERASSRRDWPHLISHTTSRSLKRRVPDGQLPFLLVFIQMPEMPISDVDSALFESLPRVWKES